MKKIIAVFDGLKFSPSTREHALEISRQTSAALVGSFLEDPVYHGYHIYDLVSEEGNLYERRLELEKKDQKKRAAAIAQFEKRCRQAGINFMVHKERGTALAELLKESIYADLMILDPRENLTTHSEAMPTKFVQRLLSEVQCPVLLVSPAYQPIRKLVLLYDGEPSSLFAIKMLSYTLPAYSDLPVEVVTVKPIDDTSRLPEKTFMKEFMGTHFKNVIYTILKGTPELQLENYLMSLQSHALVVLGAYSRGRFSRWLNPSLANMVMTKTQLPIFIAHNK